MRVSLIGSRRCAERRRGEHGAAAVIVAITTTVVMGFLAFVTDFGMAYTNKRGLQNGADAAALAVAQEIALNGSPTASCAQLEATWEGDPDVNAIADQFFDSNHPVAGADHSDPELSCVGAGTQLVVHVDTAQESTTFFGGIVADGLSLNQSATAVVGPADTVIGLRPFSMCLGLARQIILEPTVNHTLLLNNADFGCGGASGNWGMMDFNGGSNPAWQTKEWILDGYSGPISTAPPVYIPGDPGAPSPGGLESAMDSILDQEIAIPVYDLLSGSGNNARFRVMGFLSIKVCAWKFQNKDGEGLCYDGDLVPVPTPQNFLQVRYTGFIPLGDISSTCLLANTACDLGTRLAKLAE